MQSAIYYKKQKLRCSHLACDFLWSQAFGNGQYMAPKAGRGRTAEKTLAAVIGIRLEQLAAEHGDLTRFLAKVGISPGTYYLLIRGDANPTLDTLELIAKGLGLSVWGLMGLNDGDVEKALGASDIDLDAIRASSRARVEAMTQLENQRVEFRKKSGSKGS